MNLLDIPESHTALEAEIDVLGSSLLDPEAFLNAREIITANDFYKDAHRTIWKHLELLYNAGQPLDMDLLVVSLRDVGKLEDIGGYAYLLGLQRETAVSVYSKFYAQVVKDKAMLRALDLAGRKIMSLTREHTNVQDALTQANKVLNSVTDGTQTHVEKSLMDNFDSVYAENVNRGKGISDDIFTGLIDVDRAIGGFRPGQLVIIAGRPSMGKSAAALQIAIHAGQNHKRGLVFSLEMYQEELLQRAVAMRGNMDYSKFQFGKLDATELARGQALSEIPVIVSDQRGITADQIAMIALKAHRKDPLKFVVIDFLQRIADRPSASNEVKEIGHMTKVFKDLAGALHCPVILVSQLSRKNEERMDKRPALSDLRGSGNIEEDADTVIFPYREAYYTKNEKDLTAEWIIAKCRSGRLGKIDLRWFGAYQKFVNASTS